MARLTISCTSFVFFCGHSSHNVADGMADRPLSSDRDIEWSTVALIRCFCCSCCLCCCTNIRESMTCIRRISCGRACEPQPGASRIVSCPIQFACHGTDIATARTVVADAHTIPNSNKTIEAENKRSKYVWVCVCVCTVQRM